METINTTPQSISVKYMVSPANVSLPEYIKTQLETIIASKGLLENTIKVFIMEDLAPEKILSIYADETNLELENSDKSMEYIDVSMDDIESILLDLYRCLKSTLPVQTIIFKTTYSPVNHDYKGSLTIKF